MAPKDRADHILSFHKDYWLEAVMQYDWPRRKEAVIPDETRQFHFYQGISCKVNKQNKQSFKGGGAFSKQNSPQSVP